MTLSEFCNKYQGQKVDFDGAYGAQCFTKDHCVLMSDFTYKPIQDVMVGDKVVGIDNTINTVVKTFKSEKQVVHIKTELSDLYITPDHLFYFLDGEYHPVTYLKEEKPSLFDKENFEESGLSDNELRFYGFFLGDGNISHHNDGRTDEIKITFGEKKRSFVESLGCIGKIYRHYDCENAFIAGLLKSEHQKLTELILKYHREYKCCPLIFSNREYSLILEGFIRADGSLHHNSYNATNTSISLLMSLQAMCIKMGYSTKSIRSIKRSNEVVIHNKVVQNIKPLYRFTVTKKSKGELRQYAQMLELSNQTVYNIETDGSHSFICNNYKVHNCVDLFRQYCKDVWNLPHTGVVEGAKDLYLNYDELPLEKKYLRKLPKTMTYGDVVVFGATPTNKFGHVAIFLVQEGDDMLVFEQNGFAQDGAKYVWRSVQGMLGVLRKR